MESLSTQLSKLQSELKPINKNTNNPFFKSKYVDLAGASDVILPLLSKHGLSVSQQGEFIEGKFVLRTVLRYKSEEISSMWPVLSKDNTAQGTASGFTYARRYALMAIVGASAQDEDDDGNHAEGRTQLQKPADSPKNLPNHAPKVSHPISAGDFIMPFGQTKGVMIKQLQTEEIKSAMEWAVGKGKFLDFVKAAQEYLQDMSMLGSDLVPNFNPQDELPF